MVKIQVNKLHTLTGHNDCIYALAEAPDPRYFFTGSGDGMVVLWDLDDPKDGKLIAKVNHSVYALEVDPQRNQLIIGHNFEGIHVIDLVNQKELWSLNITNQSIFDIKVSDKNIFVGTADGMIIVIDTEMRVVKRHLKISEKSVRVLALSPTGHTITAGLSDHSIKVFDLKTLDPIHNLTAHTNSVFALGYNPNLPVMVSGGRDASLKIWDTRDYSLKQTIIAHLYAINYLAYREDGRYFVTCSMDKSIKVWDAESYKLLKVIDKARYAGHGTSINKVAWSRYNQNIISISDDRKISIWNLEF
ncbi:WD40 repeat domain-containing protein [Aquiflexum sp. TKW24L]|uniref:WD40 repeat domain-containing protein n=1 Tax=Aquiflexum sp. TKW24L TaxID=2942212 RepID=UPI0020C01D06|nr:WD40 repeat domain-containing protein [Aquiflexum sp. TKW24L]MCL6258236.1 WD40 repeat domain-containing protein [Aquiflexum sp. TKW24L]